MTYTVFNSSFAKGKAAATSLTVTKRPYKCIIVDGPFDLFHATLYYIYTKRSSFASNVDIVSSGPLKSNRPKLCCAEDIYVLADRMLLDNLKRKAFDFLELTCASQNITAPTLGELASVYPEMRSTYTRCFFNNKGLMNDPEECQKFFSALQNLGKQNDLICLILGLEK